MKNFRIVFMVVLCFGLVFLTSGCEVSTVRGGGWIPSVTEGLDPDIDHITADDAEDMNKAIFGFTCKIDNVVYGTFMWEGVLYEYEPLSWDTKGQFNYHDEAAGVKIKGIIIEGTANYDNNNLEGSFIGYYDPSSKVEGDEGEFHVLAIDKGEQGVNPHERDWFSIEVTGGLYDGYSNNFYILGGNIQTQHTLTEEHIIIE